jgi:hypothetical protein
MRSTRCQVLLLAALVAPTLTVRDARADSSNDTFTGTAKTIVDWSGAISNLYGTYQAATAIAQAIGLLQDPNQDILNELQALHQQIDGVASAISWYIAEDAREKRLTDLRDGVFVTNDAVSNGRSVDWFALGLTTSNIVSEGGIDTAFKRFYVDSDTDGAAVYSPQIGGLTWKTVISYSKADLLYDNKYVYDWRLGLPALLQLIALRLQLMAMQDPNFTTDGAFHDELMGYHDTLLQHLQTMTAGIRCNTEVVPPFTSDGGSVYPNYEFWVSCADIYTGLNQTNVLLFGDAYPLNYSSCVIDDGSGGSGYPTYDQACLDRRAVDYNGWYQANVQAAQDQAYRDVRFKTPWFGAKALADTLYLFANGLADLTRRDSGIHVGDNQNLCLDVPWGSFDAGTQVQIYSCNGDPTSQSWSYSREQQSIVETSSGLCLDVQNGNGAPQTPVWTWWCNGTAAQRWTYDPQSQVLTNMLGNVLDIPWDNLQAGQLLWTWPRNDTGAQHWQ